MRQNSQLDKVLLEIMKTENWRLRVKEISRKTGVPQATIHDYWHRRLKHKFNMQVREKSDVQLAHEQLAREYMDKEGSQ